MSRRIQTLWACYARLYDWLWADPLGAVLAHAIRSLAGQQGLVADIGAGTGLIGSRFAAAGHKVISIDSSESMLRMARPSAAAATVGRAEQLPLRADSIDIVLAVNLLHLHPRPLAALREMLRVSKQSGRVICTWPDDTAGPFHAAVAEHKLGLSMTMTAVRAAVRLAIGIFGVLAGARRTSSREIQQAFEMVAHEARIQARWRRIPNLAQTIVIIQRSAG